MRKYLVLIAFLAVAMTAWAEQSPAVELKVDKKIIHPELLGYGENTTLLEALQILPEIISRTTGSLLPNYSVELDGKDVGDAKDVVLQQTRLMEIDCIEVSTNPSASEQRNGEGGKINVKLRQLDEGISGAVHLGATSRWNVQPAAYFGYRRNRLELRATAILEYEDLKYERDHTSYIRREETDPHRTLYMEDERQRSQFVGQTAKLNLKYTATPSDVLNIWVMETGTWQRQNGSSTAESHTAIDGDSVFRFRYGNSASHALQNRANIHAIAEYQHLFRNQAKLIMEATYTYNPAFSSNGNHYAGDYYLSLRSIDSDKKTRKHGASLTVKTQTPIPVPEGHTLKMEVGANANWDRIRANYTDSLLQRSMEQSYFESLGAGNIWYVSPYMEWSYVWQGLDAKMGVRYQYQQRQLHYEDTPSDDLREEPAVVNHDVTANLNIGYHFTDNHHLRLMLARNLIRPSNQQVYPGFVNDWAANTCYVGNVTGETIRNTHAHSAELDYVFQWDRDPHQLILNAGLRYVRMTHIITQEEYPYLGSPMKTVVFRNGGSAHVGMLDLALYYRYKRFSFAFANNYYLKKGCFYYNFSLAPVYAFPKDWTLSGTVIYNSRVEQGQSWLGDCFYTELRLNKSWQRWSFYAVLSDIFNYHTIDRINYSSNEYEQVTYDLYPRCVAVGFAYRFNKE